MPEVSKRTADLLIDEARGAVQLNDLARHREWQAEVLGLPRHLFAEPNRTARDAVDGSFT